MSIYYSTCFVNHSNEDDRSFVETCLVNSKNWSFSLKYLRIFLHIHILLTRKKSYSALRLRWSYDRKSILWLSGKPLALNHHTQVCLKERLIDLLTCYSFEKLAKQFQGCLVWKSGTRFKIRIITEFQYKARQQANKVSFLTTEQASFKRQLDWLFIVASI